MASYKDKDYHKLRNPKKYFGEFTRRQVITTVENQQVVKIGLKTKEMSDAEKAYDKLWRKYGMKSMVADKRRRCTTRKSNQKYKPLMRQKRRAREKEVNYKLINFEEPKVDFKDVRKW